MKQILFAVLAAAAAPLWAGEEPLETWELDNPRIHFRSVDGVTKRFTVRKIERRGSDLYLNGARVDVKAVDWPAGAATCGVALTDRVVKRAIIALKGRGYNVLRPKGMPAGATNWCERIGLLVEDWPTAETVDAAEIVKSVPPPASYRPARTDASRVANLHLSHVHRGGGKLERPDNTLETFLWCWGNGSALECDCRKTADGVGIMLHDPTLERTGRGIPKELARKSVSGELTWADIADVDVGSYLSPAYAAERIPRMDAVMQAMAGHPKWLLFVDEKGAGPAAIAASARKAGVVDQVYYTGESVSNAVEWMRQVPGGRTLVWIGGWPWNQSAAECRRVEAHFLKVRDAIAAAGWSKSVSAVSLHSYYDPDFPEPFIPSTAFLRRYIAEFKAHGIPVCSIPFKGGETEEVYYRLFELGCDGFSSDYPSVMFKVIRELKGLARESVRDGLHGRVLGLYDRVGPSTARGPETPAPSLSLAGWRGERVHAQVVVWSGADQRELAVSATPLASAGGARLDAGAFASRFLRTVRAQCRPHGKGDLFVGDCLDASAKAWPAEGYRVVWMTFDIPRTASPGDYAGEVTVSGATGKRVFRVSLKVVDRILPDAGGRKFFLDLWQHPWNVAAYYGEEPLSDANYAHLEPIYRELARAGQRAILTSIVDLPWGEEYDAGGGEIRSMVDYVRDGRRGYVADFSRFDRYVEFAKACGMGPQIHCYTIVKFNSKHIFYYTDGKTGERRAVELYEGTAAYERFLTPLLRQLARHLEEKGWMDDAYIAIDEVPPERLRAAIGFLKRVAPKFKVALASNVDPLRNRAIDPDVDVLSQILWKNDAGITNIFTAAYDAFRDRRRARGQTTTFYVCTEPQKPNTWLESPLAESAWIGLYAAAKNYDGFLRWAVVRWPKDPWNYTGDDLADMPAGEALLLYPDGCASSRWEILRDGIEDWEKIRLLREARAVAPDLQACLDALDWAAVNADPEDETRRKVESVQTLLNR